MTKTRISAAPVYLDRPPEKDDAVQLISNGRPYAVVRVLTDGKVRIWTKGHPMMDVWPERLRVLHRAPMTSLLGAGGLEE
jgi:hypothetical protein